MVSRGIFVISAPRSGSSMLAGALHQMGVDMGEGYFQPTDKHNPKGYFEDMRWRKITNYMTGHRYTVRKPTAVPPLCNTWAKSLFARLKNQRIWGVKDPRLCFVYPLFEENLDFEKRIILIERDENEVIDSLLNHSKNAYGGRYELTTNDTIDIVDDWQETARNVVIESKNLLRVKYSKILEAPEYNLSAIEKFCFDGIKSYSKGIEKAIQFIDPELKHENDNSNDVSN